MPPDLRGSGLRHVRAFACVLLAAWALPLACSQEEFDLEDECGDAALALARRAYDCTGDVELSSRVQDEFQDRFRCVVPGIGIECSRDIRRATCSEVKLLETDLRAFLQATACSWALGLGDGGVGDGGPG